MADYFTNFSVAIRLPDESAQTYSINLASQACCGRQGDELPADFPEDLKDAIEGWDFETEADSPGPALWFHSNYGGVDSLCAFIQHLLQKFNPTGRVEFEWSNDCSKPRLDAYGGGAAIVTATEIKTMSTCQWLQENANAA